MNVCQYTSSDTNTSTEKTAQLNKLLKSLVTGTPVQNTNTNNLIFTEIEDVKDMLIVDNSFYSEKVLFTSEFVSRPTNEMETGKFHPLTLGTNVFNGVSNPISRRIYLDSDSSAIADGVITVSIDNSDNSCDVVGTYSGTDDWDVLLDSSDPKYILFKALNNANNNTDTEGLITVDEDTTFNTSYALGGSLSDSSTVPEYYYTKSTNLTPIEANSLNVINKPSENNLAVTVDDLATLSQTDFGTYMIYVADSEIDADLTNDEGDNVNPSNLPVQFKQDGITDAVNVYVNTATNIQINSQTYDNILGDISLNGTADAANDETYSFKLELVKNESVIDNKYYQFNDNNANSLFTLDSSNLIGNLNYMSHVNSSQMMRVVQQPLVIVKSQNDATSQENIAYFNVSSDGEKLSSTHCANDANITLYKNDIYNRVNRTLTEGGFVDELIGVYYNSEVSPIYGSLSNSDCLCKYIDYSIKTMALDANVFDDSVTHFYSKNNNAVLFIDNNDSANLGITFTNELDEQFITDNAVVIKIDANITLASSSTVYTTVNGAEEGTGFMVSAFSNTPSSTEYLYDKYRLSFQSKTIDQLPFVSAVNTGSSGWNLSLASGDTYVKTSGVSLLQSIVPYDVCRNIIMNDNSATVSIEYISSPISDNFLTSSYSTDSIKATTNYNGINHVSYISQTDISIATSYSNTVSETLDISANTILPVVGSGKSLNNLVFKRYVTTENIVSTCALSIAGISNVILKSPSLTSISVSYTLETVNGMDKTADLRFYTIDGNNFTSSESFSSGTTSFDFTLNKECITSFVSDIEYFDTVWTSATNNNKVNVSAYHDTLYSNTIRSENGTIVMTFQLAPKNAFKDKDTSPNLEVLDLPNGNYHVELIRRASDIGVDFSISGKYYNDNDFKILDSNFNSYLPSPNSTLPNSALPNNGVALDFRTTTTYDELLGTTLVIEAFDDDNNSVGEMTLTYPVDKIVSKSVVYSTIGNKFRVIKTSQIDADSPVETLVTLFKDTGFTNRILVDNGVVAHYDINTGDVSKLGCSSEFTLLNESIAVNMVGTISESLQQISNLEYQYISGNHYSEKFTLGKYRGFGGLSEMNHTYKIERNGKFSLSYEIIEDDYVFSTFSATNGHSNIQHNVNLDNGLGDFGLKLTQLYSRIPGILSEEYFYTNVYDITINADNVVITQEYLNNSYTESTDLKDNLLFDFNNSYSLVPTKVSVDENLTYIIKPSVKLVTVSYSSNYLGGDFSNMTFSEIDTFMSTSAYSGYVVDGKNINITTTTSTRKNKTSYAILCPPVITYTSYNINAVKKFPVNISDFENFNSSDSVTVYLQAENKTISPLHPFSGIVGYNNISFSRGNKDWEDYGSNTQIKFSSKNSKLVIKDYLKNNNVIQSSERTLFDGDFSQLMTPGVSNLLSVVKDDSTNTFTCKYAQNSNIAIGDNSNQKNIQFNLEGYVLPSTTTPLSINLVVGEGSVFNFYAAIQTVDSAKNLIVRLYNFDAGAIDYANEIPNIRYLKVTPTNVSYQDIEIPDNNVLTNVAYNLKTVLSNLTSLDNLSAGPWTQINNANMTNKIFLQFSPLTIDGADLLPQIFAVVAENPFVITMIETPDLMQSLGANGVPSFRIRPNGAIITSQTVTSVLGLTPQSNLPYDSYTDISLAKLLALTNASAITNLI
jgi:hypothetical protein